MASARRLAAAICAAMLAGGGAAAEDTSLLVSVAASLSTAARDIADRYRTHYPGDGVVFNTASSGLLMRQIERGAPVDLFLSASPLELDRLEQAGLLRPGTRRRIAANRLVIVVPRGRTPPQTPGQLVAPAFDRIAVGNPRSVPAGRYAEQALRAAGIWEQLGDRLVFAEHVRQVVDYVARGEVATGVVYATDARLFAERIVAGPGLDPRSHDPIHYEVAILRDAPRPDAARRLHGFLLSAEAQAALARHGFSPVEE